MKLWMIALACCVGMSAKPARACEKHAHGPTAAAAKTEFKDESLYHGTSKWRDTTGKDLKLADLQGQKILITMAYSHCTYTCPMTIAKLKEIETALAAKGLTDYKIVIASFDPEKDTPARLSEYLKAQRLPENRWVFLSPRSDKDVRQLAAMLGITYSKDAKGEYAHSNIIAFLDSEGVMRESLNGIAADHTRLVTQMAGKGHGG